MVIDPACGVEIEPSAAGATLEHNGTTYYFCSTGCLKQFETDPEKYLDTPYPALITSDGMVTPRVPYKDSRGTFELTVDDPGKLGMGDRVEFTKTLTDDDVQKFAEASGDTNALHLVDEFAEHTRFGKRIVHGTLVAGLISAALAAFPGLSIYLSQNLEFRRPVELGETVTAICEVVEELEDDRLRVTTRVENSDGEIVIHGTATVLIDSLPSLPDN